VHYLARHGESRSAKAVLISAVPPLMVKTEACRLSSSAVAARNLGRPGNDLVRSTDRPDRCDTVGRSLGPQMTVSLLSDLRPLERGRNALVGGGVWRETLPRFGIFERPDQTERTSPREFTDGKQRNGPQ
jgi:hypothetical protein